MAHHSIGSIREMVRQYREELSCQAAHCIHASPGRMLLRNEEEKRASSPHEGRHKRVRDKKPVSVQKLCWHETPPNGTPTHERTGTCTPLRFRMDDLIDFQDLDRRAAEVLRRRLAMKRWSVCGVCSQQVLSEGGQACKSPAAPVSKRRPHSNRTQMPSACNGHLRTSERRNQCCARDVVARNFEEIDKILGESNLIMEQNSSSDKVLSCTNGGMDTFELRKGVKHVKQDVEAREVAAIKAANDYLNKSNGRSNILLSERLLENIPKGCAEEVLITTCRRFLGMTPDQERTFNTNKHELQTTVSPPSTTLKSFNGTKVRESTTAPTTLLESKWVPAPESERQWLSEGEHVHSLNVDFASMIASTGTWKYTDKFDVGEDSTQLLDLDGRDFATTTPSTVELTQLFPMEKTTKKSCKNRDMRSIQMPASFGQEMDRDLPVSESQSCTGRGLRKEDSCLELDGMKHLSTEDLLLTLENPRKVRASLRPSLSKDRICEGRGTYRPEQYLSHEKSSTVGEFESSFAGDPEGNDEESRAYSGILASLEQEAFDRTSAPASGPYRYVLNPDVFQRSKSCHSEDAAQLLGCSAKCRGTKDKDNRSPAWMQSLNVRKPSKWRAMSNTHTRAAASLLKGTVAVEELEELALRCNQPEGAATVNNSFKSRLQEDVDYRASIPNDNLVSDRCKRSRSPSPTSASNGLPNGFVSLPRVSAIRENPHVSIAPKDPRVDVAPANESTFSSGLDSLISEVVHEWVEECSTSSPKLSATSVSPDESGVGTISACSITDEQALETGNWSANGALFSEKTLPTDSESVKVARKRSVEALASIVQPLLAALQEAEIDEPIVTEFEADETVRLLLEKLHFYEKKIRASKKRQGHSNFENENSAVN